MCVKPCVKAAIEFFDYHLGHSSIEMHPINDHIYKIRASLPNFSS